MRSWPQHYSLLHISLSPCLFLLWSVSLCVIVFLFCPYKYECSSTLSLSTAKWQSVSIAFRLQFLLCLYRAKEYEKNPFFCEYSACLLSWMSPFSFFSFLDFVNIHGCCIYYNTICNIYTYKIFTMGNLYMLLNLHLPIESSYV